MTTYVLMAGLPGSGKSTLANALARQLNGVVLSKDVVRAAIFPGALTDYSREQDDLCFTMLLEAAAYLAARQRTDFIFLDGRTFSRAEHVDQAIGAAAAAGCGWRILLAVCPDEIAEARLAKDAAAHPAANRTVAMYRRVRSRFAPIPHPHLPIDTSEPLEAAVRRAREYISGTSPPEAFGEGSEES